jgi:hypothetical protein
MVNELTGMLLTFPPISTAALTASAPYAAANSAEENHILSISNYHKLQATRRFPL